MTEQNRKEMYDLSSQLIELFISDVFSKNDIKTADVKEKITKEQRENLKLTVSQLKEQVEDFLHSRKTAETEEANDQNNEQPQSPLREKFFKKKQNNNDGS